MKIIGSILIFVVALHSLCGVECLSGDLEATARQPSASVGKPACHDEPENAPASPADDHSLPQNKGNSCAQAQAFESRVSHISKCVIQCLPVADITSFVWFDEPAIRAMIAIATETRPAFSPPTQQSVLRI